jgi:MarR family transcriptional regulator, lower aerobic nicotinate degradation pathway regulator
MGRSKALPRIADKREANPEEYQLDEQIGYLLRVALQRHYSLFSDSMIEGLTAPQYASMYKLFELGSCSQNQLGRLINVDVATINGIVRRLEAKGFLTLRGDPHDARRHEIALSAEGRRIVQKAVPIAMEISEKTLKSLSDGERNTLLKLLKKVG